MFFIFIFTSLSKYSNSLCFDLNNSVIYLFYSSYARKRHAEIRLSSEIGRRMAELKRIQALNQLMADLDTSKVYTVQVRIDCSLFSCYLINAWNA